MGNVAFKGNAVSGPIQQHRRSHALRRHGRDERRILSGIAWNLINGPFTFQGTGIDRCQIDITATFIHHDYQILVVAGYLSAVGSSGLLVPLGGSQRLFLRVQPKRLIARPTVHSLTDVAWVAFHNWV